MCVCAHLSLHERVCVSVGRYVVVKFLKFINRKKMNSRVANKKISSSVVAIS